MKWLNFNVLKWLINLLNRNDLHLMFSTDFLLMFSNEMFYIYCSDIEWLTFNVFKLLSKMMIHLHEMIDLKCFEMKWLTWNDWLKMFWNDLHDRAGMFWGLFPAERRFLRRRNFRPNSKSTSRQPKMLNWITLKHFKSFKS